MYSKSDLNDLLKRVVQNIDISDDMFDAAVNEYQALGQWIDKKTPDYKISLYPQGSFGLGTVIRPISDADDFDLDIVCQFSGKYNLTAKELKLSIVKPLLVGYKKSSKGIENKRRCWHIDYDDLPNFHIDFIPAYSYYSSIKITDHNEELDSYEYIGSNPAGYIEWFFSRCAYQRNRLYEAYVREHRQVVAQADIENVKRRKVKTPLQRAIQLLKRHRDIMFSNDITGSKPISIIITTVAAYVYEEEENVVDAITNILNKMLPWVNEHKKNGLYYIQNPSLDEENFADKWNTHPERADSFYRWVKQAQQDFNYETIKNKDIVSMGYHIRRLFGDNTGKKVFSGIAKSMSNDIYSGKLRVATDTGELSTAGTIKVLANHHHGN